MVEEKDTAEAPPPPKLDGIELMMYPLNPDGTWTNGKPPRNSTPLPYWLQSSRTRASTNARAVARWKAAGLLKVTANDRLRKVTVNRVAGEPLPR